MQAKLSLEGCPASSNVEKQHEITETLGEFLEEQTGFDLLMLWERSKGETTSDIGEKMQISKSKVSRDLIRMDTELREKLYA